MPVKYSLRLSLLLLIACLMALNFQPSFAQSSTDTDQAVANAIGYLKSQQQPDGGIMGFAGTSDPDTTIRTVIALGVNNQPYADFVSEEGNTLFDFLASQAEAYVHDPNGLLFPGRAGLLLTAVALAGQEVNDFGGLDLAGKLAATFQADTGTYATEAALDYSSGAASDLNQGWAVLGLALAGQPIPTQATFYLAGTQAEDGSWAGGDLDTTALVLTALLASRNVPAEDAMIDKALEFFKANQLDNGGWKPSWDEDPLNADTTGWVMLALKTAGQAPLEETWSAAEGNPTSALLSLVKEDGSIGGSYVNAYSTADALTGLGEATLTSLGMPVDYQRAALVVQNGDGTLITACISFEEESISGFELLSRSRLEIASVTDPSLGTAVCSIGAEGCPSSNCFCDTSNYWSYWQRGRGDWAYATSGAEQTMVRDGTIEAWSWGEGTPPAVLTFTQVCQPGSVQPATVAVQSQSVAPSAYPEPAATATRSVESYPEPAATATTGVQSYPEPAAEGQTEVIQPTRAAAYPEPSAITNALAPAVPYLILLVLIAGLFLGVMTLARRQK